MRRVKACLNGGRTRTEHASVPITPRELAADAAAAVAASAFAVHIHPRDAAGAESLEPADVDAAVEAVRAAIPGVPVGVTTALWASAGEAERLAAIRGWESRPDMASVNLSEPGWEAVADTLEAAGTAVEWGVWSLDEARALLAAGRAERCVRILVETQPADPHDAVAEAEAIEGELARARVAAPRLHHGEGPATWVVIRAAHARGIDVRIGLEDVLTLPDGRSAAGNAELVVATTSA